MPPTVKQPAPPSFVGEKVCYIQIHFALMAGSFAHNSFHHRKHHVDMTIVPFGVFCKFRDTASEKIRGKRFIVPFANIEAIEFDERAGAD